MGSVSVSAQTDSTLARMTVACRGLCPVSLPVLANLAPLLSLRAVGAVIWPRSPDRPSYRPIEHGPHESFRWMVMSEPTTRD